MGCECAVCIDACKQFEAISLRGGRMRRLLAALAVAIGLLLALSGPALAVAVGPKAINPTSDPFRTCPVGANTGRNYLDSEVEPYGAVNPTDSANVIAVWQQD